MILEEIDEKKSRENYGRKTSYSKRKILAINSGSAFQLHEGKQYVLPRTYGSRTSTYQPNAAQEASLHGFGNGCAVLPETCALERYHTSSSQPIRIYPEQEEMQKVKFSIRPGRQCKVSHSHTSISANCYIVLISVASGKSLASSTAHNMCAAHGMFQSHTTWMCFISLVDATNIYQRFPTASPNLSSLGMQPSGCNVPNLVDPQSPYPKTKVLRPW